MEYMIKLLVKLDQKAQKLVEDAKSKVESGMSRLKSDKLELAAAYKERIRDELDKFSAAARTEAEKEIQAAQSICNRNITFLDGFRNEQGEKLAAEIAKRCTGE